MKMLLVLIAALTLIAAAEGATSLSESTPMVRFENGRLSVKAGDAPLKDLLSEIQIKSRIIIELKDSKAAAKPSSVEFKHLSPTLAFQTILRDVNFAFFYSGNRLARVLILPPGDQSPTASSALINPNRPSPRFPRTETAPLKRAAGPRLPGETTKDSDVTAKLEAIEAIEDSDDPKSIAALGEALTDPQRKVKEAALKALAHKKAANVTQTLRRGLNDSDPEFRIEVLETLADRGDLDSLRKALADRNQQMRETAVDLLWNATTQN
jgi:HEAT repeat protein